jgi:hypothetical protein
MGGYGSGYYGGGIGIAKDTVESTLHINVNRLKKEGALRDGAEFTLKWAYTIGYDQEERKSSVGGYFEKNILTLSYTHQNTHKKPQIPVDWTPCHYGGYRPWFKCSKCAKRYAKLYVMKGEWECRKCHNLTYTSCQIRGDIIAECDRKINKIGNRLDIGDPWGWDTPIKPKYMHDKTYYDLRIKLNHLRDKRQQLFIAGAAEITGQSDVRKMAYNIRNSI